MQRKDTISHEYARICLHHQVTVVCMKCLVHAGVCVFDYDRWVIFMFPYCTIQLQINFSMKKYSTKLKKTKTVMGIFWLSAG